MKVGKFLKESVVFIPSKDAPDWAIPILKKRGIKSDIKVVVYEIADIAGVWHEADVVTYYMYDNGTIKVATGSGKAGPWSTRSEKAIYSGFSGELSKSRAILAVHSYPKSARLYVHPESMAKLLPTNQDDLSNEELFVLGLCSGLKSAYRREEAAKYNVNYDSILSLLLTKGYVNKNGSINVTGKNAIVGKDVSPYKLGLKPKYGY